MSIVQILMERDEISREEAEEILEDMRSAVHEEGEDPYEVLQENGLEPDYFMDLF
jgi:hypothetical protein